MTERRHEMAGAIRKQRKSHAVALKRRVGAGAVAAAANAASSAAVPSVPVAAHVVQTMDTTSGEPAADTISKEANALRTQIATISAAYIKAAGTADEAAMLAALQSAVANADAAICSEAIDSLLTQGGMAVNNGNRNDQETGAASASALLLADTLARTLISQDSFATDESRLNAARVLTNLAVCGTGGDMKAVVPTSSSHGSDDGDAATGGDDNYYGNLQETWCDILVRSSAVRSMLEMIVHLTRQLSQQISQQLQQQQQMSPIQLSGAAVSLCEQCCWAVGNLGGDSQRIRDRLHALGALRPLICALRLGLVVADRERNVDQGNRNEEASTVVGLCRNAAWALSNLARGTYTSALPFLQIDDEPNTANHNESLLTPMDMLQLIAVHGRSRCDVAAANKSRSGLSTWADVSIECSWLLTLLTSKEDVAVEFIFRGGSTDAGNNNFAFCASLASGLYKASNSASSPEAATAELALRCAVPCIRIAGNIAASCDGRYVPNLLGHYRVVEKLAISLSILIDLGARHGRDHAVLAAEACWAVGTMLVDAGRKNHPSTQSIEILVPALCNALTSASSRSELRREAVSALCNAVAPPPTDADMMDQTTAEDSQEVRDRILKTIISTHGVIPTLCSLLTCYDADAVFASLSLVNDIMRRIAKVDKSIKTRFAECNIVDALETICDRASAATSYGNSDTWQSSGSAQEQSAEMAADLIDDFFDDDGMDDDVIQDIAPDAAVGAATFAFGLGSAETPRAFDFGGPSAPGTSGAPANLGAGRGRGRGRGATMPAWMKN